MQADTEGGQGLGEGLGQQAGSTLEKLHTAAALRAMAVVWLILVARLGGMAACSLLVLILLLGMDLAGRCRIAEAEGETV